MMNVGASDINKERNSKCSGGINLSVCAVPNAGRDIGGMRAGRREH